MKNRKPASACACGSGLAQAQCCEPLIKGERPAPTAEALMRSRYVAYALHADDYVLATWHPSTRPPALNADEVPIKWVGLEVHAHHPDGERAQVEFTACYKVQGRLARLHEVSRFVFEQGRWWYVDGDHPS
ncbi:MAG TPA: YchJ family metal-binding protein [Candidatus Kapabacteria bacterium]|nr:YchJ family metal-binding protein [Candidatus Kapabacteria bacterium]